MKESELKDLENFGKGKRVKKLLSTNFSD